MSFDEPQLFIRRPRDFGEHVGCARIAQRRAHRLIELGRPPHAGRGSVLQGHRQLETKNFSLAGLKNVLAVAAVGPDLKRQAFSNWSTTHGGGRLCS
jgi:hypothetical protein